MHKTLQKLGALALAGAMTLTLFSGAAPAALAAGDTTPTGDITGTFQFDPHEGSTEIGDLTDSFIYNDNYFSGDSSVANEHLATMSMQLAAASISSQSYDRRPTAYANRSKNVKDLLNKLRFTDISVNQNYDEKMGENTMGVAVAHKDLGNNTVLLAIVPRSAGYESEWSGNFNVGTGAEDGLHEGFKEARDIALTFAKKYISDHSSAFPTGKTVKVWIAGYSRGAAVANLIGAAIVDNAQGCIGVNVESTNVFDYTFGTPATVIPTTGTDPRAEKYKGIHNYYSDYDPVTMMPFSNWEFTRYGQDTLLNDDPAQKDRMLNFLQQLNPTVHYLYTKKGGDPDYFTAMTFDPQTMTIQPVEPRDPALTQQAFFKQRIDYLTNHRVKNRDAYVSGHYQDMLRTLMVLNFGGDGQGLTNLAGLLQSDLYRDEATNVAELIFGYSLMQNCAEQYGDKTTPNMQEVTSLMEQYPSLKESLKQKMGIQYDYQLLLGIAASDYGELATKLKAKAVESLQALLEKCISNTDPLRPRLVDKDKFATPLVDFLSAFVFGVELDDTQKKSNSMVMLAQLEANTAATIYGNTNSYMRVHNNEVLVSWLRTKDSNYRERYTVTVNGAAIGQYQAGDTVQIDGTPTNTFRMAFKSWNDPVVDNEASLTLDESSKSSMTTTFTMPAGNVSITSNEIARIRNTTLTVAKPVTGEQLPTEGILSWTRNGNQETETISVSWQESSSKQPASGTAQANKSYSVKADVSPVPSEDFVFAFDISERSERVRYTENDAGTSVIPKDAFVDAAGCLNLTGPAVTTGEGTPTQPTETCTVTINGKAPGTEGNLWTKTDTYNKGETVTITAPVVEDKEFEKWEGSAVAVSEGDETNPTLTINNPSDTIELTAVYIPVITELDLQMAVPTFGQKLAVADQSAESREPIASITWTPTTNGSLPAWNTVYTAKVTLKPTSVLNYVLSDKINLKLNGKTSGIAATVAKENDHYVIYIKFGQVETPIEQVKFPRASLKSGSYSGAQRIYLSSETTDATIYYTLDGTEPTTKSPHCASREFITLPNATATTTLKLLAVKDGMTESDVPTYTYNIQRVSSSSSSKPVQKPEDKPAEEPKQDYKNCKHDSTCPLAQFTDLDVNAWYHDGVHDCLDQGLMAGYGDGKFGPNDSISRAQVVTVLWRMAKSPAPTAANAFTDVPAGTWYTDAVRWAAENGVVGGYGDGRFGPNDPVTREQLAAMFYRFAQQQGRDVSRRADLGSYADAASVDAWATEAIQWACGSGILNGMDGSLVPQGTATRAQTAAMLQRLSAAAQ